MMLFRPYLEINANNMYDKAVKATIYNKEVMNPTVYASKVILFI